ncbi:MAG: hypothetical protein BGO55_30855 [Sphingobacteriales bacterium 50-39]|nr:hypothetical protein [Sphingobacteriales bacterium]OJW60918.1 MAG: hypothetical protein BGO55_30855 [Sphingobacteriales bacterium 50-39]
MLHINAIKIVIHTNTGTFGRSLTLKTGLNIIRANNTSGKSSLFGAMVYGLGFEELLGSRNDRALQSVFKSIVKEAPTGLNQEVQQSTVLQSEIYLEISNGKDSITTKRYVVNDKIKPQAVEVYFGKLLTEPDHVYAFNYMYLHDKGGASNEEIGFHRYLEEFIGHPLPEIINQEGKRVKLYLPLIAAAHFIEQKAGWSDFYANIPYYGIRDTSSKVFEYILNLDVFDLAARRQELQVIFRDLEERWKALSDHLQTLITRVGGELVGFPLVPVILSRDQRPFVRLRRADKVYTFSDLIQSLSDELQQIQTQLDVPINQNLERMQRAVQLLKEETERYDVLYENLSSDITQEKERHRQYSIQLDNVMEDIGKNKDAQKLESLGLTSNLQVAQGICPTCSQTIPDTLLPEKLHIHPMRLDENLAYLEAQKKMIEAFMANLKEIILEKETRLSALEEAIQRNRRRIRSYKKDLLSDDRLPSEEVIERKVIVERELTFLRKAQEEMDQRLGSLYSLSDEFQVAKAREVNVSGNYMSLADASKITAFEDIFKSLLQSFGFTSKPVSTIRISTEKYTPVYEITQENGVRRQVDIRFESSASDFIRAQWAYYTSLLATSNAKSGNHFGLLAFDEPQQQSASTQSLKAFLENLETYRDSQTIVFASFQNSQEDFIEATKDLSNVYLVDYAATNELVIKRVDPLVPPPVEIVSL